MATLLSGDVTACLAIFLRVLEAPCGHMWQKPQFALLLQPTGFQYHAQGRQPPITCRAEPTLGRPSVGGCSRPGGGSKLSRVFFLLADDTASTASAVSESVQSSEPEPVVDSSSEPPVPDGVEASGSCSRGSLMARPAIPPTGVRAVAPRRAFFRDLISPLGQRWQ